MIRKILRAAALVSALVLAGSCLGAAGAEAGTKRPSIRDRIAAEQEADVTNVDHSVVVYFAGWHMEDGTGQYSREVADLPWGSVDYVNHAFWGVEPAEDPEVTSFEQRLSGKGARTKWAIRSLSPEADLGDMGESTLIPGLPRNHFAQYAYFAQRFPDTRIMISFGGWTRCGYFSEMAFTPEGRASFINCCLDLMEQYPWIGGIDIDWEYPAGNRDGERGPDPTDPGDQGCPIFGTASQDRENFNALLAELRAAMAEKYGEGAKKLTACASGSTGWTLPCQDWLGASESLDLINIMTYDLAGPWDGQTGHAGSATQAKGGALYFQMQGIPMSKLCVGSPLYATPLKMKAIPRMILGAGIESQKPTYEPIDQTQIHQWESEAVSGYTLELTENGWAKGETFDRGGTGWHMDYDDRNGGAYMYNDDEASEYYCWFLSYENPLSLKMKLDYILEKGIGGIIVWESNQDTEDAAMLRQMHEALSNHIISH